MSAEHQPHTDPEAHQLGLETNLPDTDPDVNFWEEQAAMEAEWREFLKQEWDGAGAETADTSPLAHLRYVYFVSTSKGRIKGKDRKRRPRTRPEEVQLVVDKSTACSVAQLNFAGWFGKLLQEAGVDTTVEEGLQMLVALQRLREDLSGR